MKLSFSLGLIATLLTSLTSTVLAAPAFQLEERGDPTHRDLCPFVLTYQAGSQQYTTQCHMAILSGGTLLNTTKFEVPYDCLAACSALSDNGKCCTAVSYSKWTMECDLYTGGVFVAASRGQQGIAWVNSQTCLK